MRHLSASCAAFVATLAPTAVFAQAVEQAQDQNMPADTAIPALMFMTFGIVIIIAVGALAYFLSKRSNRAATEKVLNPNHPSNQ